MPKVVGTGGPSCLQVQTAESLNSILSGIRSQ